MSLNFGRQHKIAKKSSFLIAHSDIYKLSSNSSFLKYLIRTIFKPFHRKVSKLIFHTEIHLYAYYIYIALYAIVSHLTFLFLRNRMN